MSPSKQTLNEMYDQLKQAKKDLREAQKKADELRQGHLNELAEKRAEQWNLKTKDAITIIKEAEKARKLHKKQWYFLKPWQEGAISNLYVPKPLSGWEAKLGDVTNKECQMKIEEPRDIFNVLLRQNFSQLLKSEISIFTKGPLKEELRWDTASNLMERILQGMDVKNEQAHKLTGGNRLIENFLKSMKMMATASLAGCCLTFAALSWPKTAFESIA